MGTNIINTTQKRCSMRDIDDSDLIIISLTIIAIVTVIMFRDSGLPIVNTIVSGILGAWMRGKHEK